MHLRQLITLALCLVLSHTGIYAQTASDTPQKPSFFGGNPNIQLDLRKGEILNQNRIPVYDFVKFNPRYRSLLPTKRKCSTLEMDSLRHIKNGGESSGDFEEWMKRNNQGTRSLTRKAAEIYTLPVVVHVIYSNPTENISDEQILSQIRTLNQDYRRRNPDAVNTLPEFKQKAADTGIEFCLAGIDPDGRPTDGIDRISIGGSPFADVYLNDIIKPNTLWDPDRYMNIWVCNIAGGILGFAQFPSSSGLTGIPNDPGARNTDGICIHYNAFGTMGTANPPFNRGRTATHEIGHWLGLRHIWGDGPCSVDDYCADTPNASDPNFSCPVGARGCFGSAMFQNYMDYTDDACMNLFTQDQKLRIRTVLENAPRRRTLINSPACQPANTPPVADFVADVTTGCGPLVVNFKQKSQGDPDKFSWTFPGGDPGASSEPNPTVTYKYPGFYSVRLVATNPAGTGPVKIKESFITVTEEGVALPLVADFEDQNFPPKGFFMYDPQGEKGWQNTQRVSGNGTGNGAMVFNNYENNLKNSLDWFVTPVMNFSGGTGTTLAFDVSYTRFSSDYSDTLAVFISTGCESEFQAIYYQGGTALSTAEDYVRPYNPYPEEWRKEYIDLSAYDNNPEVRIAFVNISGYGNNIYLDNIKVASKAKPVPQPAFAFSSPLACEGETIEFENQTRGDVNSVTWSFPGGVPGSDTSRNPIVTYPRAGTYDVTLTAVNASGSKSYARTGAITIKPGPNLAMNTQEADICLGSTKVLSASGATSYVWSPKKGLNDFRKNTTEASPQITTTYTVTGTSANGCESQKSVTIRVNESTSFSLDPPQATICKGQSTVLTASGAGAYLWAPATGLSKTTGDRVVAAPKETTTYTVKGRNEGGCEFIRTLTVKVEETPPIYVRAEKNEICPGEEVRIKAVGADSYRWTSGSSTDVYEGELILVSPSKTTTYRVSSGTVGCFSNAETIITVHESPKIVLEDDQYLVCSGKPVQLKVSGASTFRWIPNDGLAYTKGATISVSPKQSTDYTVIGSSIHSCLDTAVIKVIVPRPPTISITASHPTICEGMSSRLSANGAADYRWSPSEGLDNTIGPVVTAQPEQSTTYTLTATDQFGCVAKRRVTVNVASIQPPVAAFGTDSRTVCTGQTIQFVDRSRFATNYRWEFPGGIPSSSTVQNPKVTYKVPGKYDVILRIEGCAGLDFKEEKGFLTVTNGKRLTVSDRELTICKGETVSLEASGVKEYRWSPANTLDSYTNSRVQAKPLENTTYTVAGIDENGCESESVVWVKVKGSGKQAKIRSASTHVCEGNQVKLQASGAENLVWKADDGEIMGRGKELIATPKRTTTYRLEGTDGIGCNSKDEVTIEVKPAPEIRIFPASITICKGDEAKLEARGGFSYEWIPFPGLLDSDEGMATVSPSETTPYIVRGIDGFGCEGEAQAIVEVNTGRSIQVIAEKELVCLGESVKLTATGGARYEWGPIENDDLASASSITVKPKTTTTYTVKSNDGDGCPGFAAFTVKVPESKPLTITPSTASICPGEPLQLFASGAEVYTWDAKENMSSTTGPITTVRPRKTTTYSVKSVDRNGCKSSGAMTVEVKEGKGISLASSASSICEGNPVSLKVKGGEAYRWLPANGLNENTRGPDASVRPVANTVYRVIGRNESGCLDTASLTVNVTQLRPRFEVTSKVVDLASEDGIVKFSDKTEGATSWFWEFGDGGTSNQPNPTHIYTQEGDYTVVLVVSNGVCTNQATELIRVGNSSSIDELLEDSGLRLYPNPTNGLLNLEITSKRSMTLKFRLMNDKDESVLSDVIFIDEDEYKQTLLLSAFPKGTYTLQLTDGREVFSKEVIYE